jgi:hypothetical protein
VRAFLAKTKGAGDASIQAELKRELKIELLCMLEAQLSIEDEVQRERPER